MSSDLTNQISIAINFITLVVSSATLVVTICTLKSAGKSFKQSTTFQLEKFFLKIHMNYKNAEAEYKHAEEKYIQAQMYLLATLDTYCKYANKELSDDELAGENITFFKNIIQEPKFKECILKHKKFFNNIIKFAEINKIKL